MADKVYKYIIEGVADFTYKMYGTQTQFPFEVFAVYINGTSVGFTWTAER